MKCGENESETKLLQWVPRAWMVESNIKPTILERLKPIYKHKHKYKYKQILAQFLKSNIWIT